MEGSTKAQWQLMDQLHEYLMDNIATWMDEHDMPVTRASADAVVAVLFAVISKFSRCGGLELDRISHQFEIVAAAWKLFYEEDQPNMKQSWQH